MSYLHRFKTSARISLVFSLFNLVSLIILLVAINISYFFIWYTDQKDASFYDMNVNYQSLISTSTSDNTEAFRQYILQKDTVILPPDDAPMVCSNGVSKKIHGDIANLQNRYFYTEGDTTYFIYSQNYEGIGEVKVFFDTTPYVTSQLIIIKMSTIIILIFLLAYFFLGRWVSRYALKGLQTIAVSAKKMAS
ncbi:MAG: hypothetical protein H6767_07950 [Candidatus Peribacteria bacterium]|nr:MAG: hypothetical protein H6767_07950 [Candidatus Peribacteria bacterium]